jgi:hypothetical protein
MKSLAVLLLSAATLQAASVAIQADPTLPAPARHGLAELTSRLTAAGHTVSRVAPGQAQQADIIIEAATSLRGEPESLSIHHTTRGGKPAIQLQGADARGLMYAALDISERVSWSPQNPLARVREVTESPYLAERGISMYTMQRAYFESRLFDDNHWRRYFDLLARSRINTFTIIFGYENGGFMAPLYPYFFDVPAHPEVRLAGITRAEQERHTQALHSLIHAAHERGIDVIIAAWDHIYRGGVQGGGIAGADDTVGKEVPGLVSGLTAQNLAPYTKAALHRFLEVFPEIDGLEFRMHGESGLKRDEMPAFWHEVFGIVAKAKPGLRVTLRAKELPDSIIDDALHQGLNARVETKYWMEQMGMPFHPTHINRQDQDGRRHGYADLLTYPQRYRVLWRLWSGGTARLLLWGDPEYVRRYAASARLYDGNSIDVNEMLATKMLGEPHERPPTPILNPKYRYYDYEFERYWHFYQVWGRVSYNPATPTEVWEEEFRRRFGAAGSSLMQALHTASKVLPRIVAASYRYQLFPTTRGWAEMMRQGDLPQFAGLEGSDIEQFQSPRDAAKGGETSQRTPAQTSRWFSATADEILARVGEAKSAGLKGNEAISTVTDLQILAWLARYHAARLNAAVAYQRKELDAAIAHERTAVGAWAEMVKAAGDVYSQDLAFGVHRVGFPRHWKEELENLQTGLNKLAEGREPVPAPPLPPAPRPPVISLEPAGKARPGHDLVVSARAKDPTAIKTMRLRYRHLSQVEDYRTADMTLDPATRRYSARIAGEFITIKWDLIYFVEVIDRAGSGRNYPDLEVQAPYLIVPVER